MKLQLDQLIAAAVENLDMDLLKETYSKMLSAKEVNQISAQDAQVFESMFESAAEMIEELY